MAEPCAMRLYTALLVLWIGLLGAVSPAFACESGASSGDCCPPDAPADCRVAWTLDRSDGSGSVSSVAAPWSSQITTIEPDAEKHAAADDGHLPDSLTPSPFHCHFFPDDSRKPLLTPDVASASADAALTYLRTGRLRL
jgi:hypothetical protein